MELYRRKQQEVQDAKDAEQDSSVITSFQKKIMTTVNTPSQMDFTNLTIGKKYRLTLHVYMQVDGSEGQISLTGSHNGSIVVKFLINGGTASDIAGEGGDSNIFTATATTVTFAQTSSGPNPYIPANTTYAILEELKNHQETTQY